MDDNHSKPSKFYFLQNKVANMHSSIDYSRQLLQSRNLSWLQFLYLYMKNKTVTISKWLLNLQNLCFFYQWWFRRPCKQLEKTWWREKKRDWTAGEAGWRKVLIFWTFFSTFFAISFILASTIEAPLHKFNKVKKKKK